MVFTGVYVFNHLPVRIECINCEDQSEIGPQGLMVFEFSRPVQPELIESSWLTEPEIEGSFEWPDNKHMRWKAESAIAPSQSLRVTIAAGVCH